MSAVPACIGRYPVDRELGRGGMGFVYLGRDMKLERPVAIKVLSDALAKDEGAFHRLEIEARLLAALNHSNVGSIYGLEETEDGARFLVLEFIEGETLEDRLARGPMDVAGALRVGSEIAAGLAAAHRRGVIHRDLKPANIRITPEGHVKLLDFGLARRTTTTAAVDSEPKDPRDGEGDGDDEGTVTGTPGYMSPEQLRGLPEDSRSDVFAFGCILYECITGRMAFGGQTVGERIRALLGREIDWSALPDTVPPRGREILTACLEESADRRPADLRRVGEEIAGVLAASQKETNARPRAPGNLPPPLTGFVGRDEEIKRLRASVASSPLLTLTGIGGCGKTRLALEVARGLAESFPDGVWVVDLAPVADSTLVASSIAVALGVREERGRSLLETVCERLRSARALILLDNCEHVLSGARAAAVALHGTCERVRLVATSREALGIPRESVHRVAPLSTPTTTVSSNAEAAAFESVRLFVARAAAVRPQFALTDANAAAVSRVCARLDGIPLAIELAAARIRVLSVEQIDARLHDRFRLLTDASAGASQRHSTLRAAMDWSYDLLSEEEKRMLRALSVFAGGWTLEAATALSGERQDEFVVLDLLTVLADKSLMTVGSGPGGEARYGFAETVRQYAGERLDEQGESAALRKRHRRYFSDLAQRASPQLVGRNQVVWLERLEIDHENLLAALADCEAAPDGAAAQLRLAASLGKFWWNRGHLGLGLAALRAALSRDGGAGDSALRCAVLNSAGLIAERQGDYALATALYEESLRLHRDHGDEVGIAATLSNLGVVAKDQGDYATAKTLTEDALALNRKLGNRDFEARNLNNLGTIAAEQGEREPAVSRFRESLAIRRALGDRAGTAVLLSNIANVTLQLGDPRAARELHLESLVIWREVGNQWGIAMTLKNLGSVAETLGDDVEATTSHNEALALRTELGDRLGVATSLESVAGLMCRAGCAREAARCLGASERLRNDLGSPLHPVERAGVEGIVAAARGALSPSEADLHFERGRAAGWREAAEEALTWLRGSRSPPPSAPAAER